MSKSPSIDNMLQAADWLEMYEPTDPDDVGCHLIADYLRQRARDKNIRDECRKAHVPVKIARARIKNLEEIGANHEP